jgi:hypothetical protein
VGIFKQLKDMKGTVAAAPGMIDQAQQLSVAAQTQAAVMQAQTAQAGGAAPAGPAEGPDFEPIAGVSLELYTEISKSLATVNYDQTKGPEMAAKKGVVAADWQAAVDGWNARMKANQAVAKRFNALYTGRA